MSGCGRSCPALPIVTELQRFGKPTAHRKPDPLIYGRRHIDMSNITVYGEGEIIFKQGDPSLHMYVIRVGSVGIYNDYGTDHEQQLTILNRGGFLGEMGMIESNTRSATAVALEKDTLVSVITIGDFATYFKEEPEKLLAVMRNMSRRMAGTSR